MVPHPTFQGRAYPRHDAQDWTASGTATCAPCTLPSRPWRSNGAHHNGHASFAPRYHLHTLPSPDRHSRIPARSSHGRSARKLSKTEEFGVREGGNMTLLGRTEVGGCMPQRTSTGAMSCANVLSAGQSRNPFSGSMSTSARWCCACGQTCATGRRRAARCAGSLCHELAHNVWGDDNNDFKTLNSQLTKEVPASHA
ncbi:hypothetical protein FA95DRAFT_171329 [Auriscalpium vulgare]|uniref:Uncharacterized protein n=1 Tax=Auriscalpium vulgare TaxID=40419 RepID=A0ACB8RLM9_9AGAM|nr:hypothetical protein FA95DRAFT_171329 [Auriscalpium vulgare]